MSETLTCTLAIERETKNTYRYAETEDSEGAGAIGTLYLSKFVATRVLGDGTARPERIRVTVEAA